jgi:hypothetical protein
MKSLFLPTKKTTRTDQVKVALERLLRDEEVHGHLRTAAARLQEATARATARRPSKAIKDKKLYGKVGEAATSLTHAGRSLRTKPKPKRRGPKLVLLAGVAGGTALALKKRGNRTEFQPAQSHTDQAPAATPAPPPVA